VRQRKDETNRKIYEDNEFVYKIELVRELEEFNFRIVLFAVLLSLVNALSEHSRVKATQLSLLI